MAGKVSPTFTEKAWVMLSSKPKRDGIFASFIALLVLMKLFMNENEKIFALVIVWHMLQFAVRWMGQ